MARADNVAQCFRFQEVSSESPASAVARCNKGPRRQGLTNDPAVAFRRRNRNNGTGYRRQVSRSRHLFPRLSIETVLAEGRARATSSAPVCNYELLERVRPANGTLSLKFLEPAIWNPDIYDRGDTGISGGGIQLLEF